MTQYFIKSIAIVVSLFVCFYSQAQTPTIGLRFYDSAVSQGYTLFTPGSNKSTYLVNNCGEKINEWTFSEKPGATCYLLKNGTLLRAGKDSLEIRDWNNNLLWSYAMNLNGILQHHDIEPLPNGNILCVVSDKYTDSAIFAQGRNPGITGTAFKLDKIVEIKPIGTNDASIEWEWSFIDHFIQDFDSTKPNYGIVEDHPELIDLNFNNNFDFDYTHVNAIDYNSALDQIIISPRHLSEIYIIDHSTTTMEAAAHDGGNSNQGGDILWRWGNPQVYRQGGVDDQQLFFQHDCRWIEDGYQDGGKITVFNNGGDSSGTFSSIHIISPEIINYNYSKENSRFLPNDFQWSWNGTILGEILFESKKSGVQALTNGNLLICETSLGQISEINKNGDHLWTYRNPITNIINVQFDTTISPMNTIFRADKYPIDYDGFLGQDLSPQGIIEDQNSLSDSCGLISSIENIAPEKITIVNPVENGIIQFSQNIDLKGVTIIDINGKTIFKRGFFTGNAIKVDLKPGMYFLRLHSDKGIETYKIIVI